MPGATPRYGIPFPLLHEVADADAIAQQMLYIDALLSTLSVKTHDVVKLPGVRVARPANAGDPTQPTGSGGTTELIWTQELYDPLGMATVGSADITIQRAGLYYAAARGCQVLGGAATTQATRWCLRRNGIDWYRRSKARWIDTVAADSQRTTLSGLVLGRAGDVIRIGGTWVGTGGPAADVRCDEFAMFMVGGPGGFG